MTKKEDQAKRIITQAIHQHMPSAAIASGWASPVDVSGIVAEAISSHGPKAVRTWAQGQGFEAGFTDLGMQAVRGYCEANGLPTSNMFVKPFRAELLKTAMRESFK